MFKLSDLVLADVTDKTIERLCGGNPAPIVSRELGMIERDLWAITELSNDKFIDQKYLSELREELEQRRDALKTISIKTEKYRPARRHLFRMAKEKDGELKLGDFDIT